MIKIEKFTFNTFQENTYIIYDDTKECIIIDPGCYEEFEKDILESFIIKNNLKPIKLINTHCHIDHVLGNYFVAKKWNLNLEINQLDLPLLNNVKNYSGLYGFDNYEESPHPTKFLNENDLITFGNSELEIIHTPGHAPGHIALFNKKEKLIVSGDVLFQNSIGRTDLPGGDYNTLINSIKEKLLKLEEDVIVYCGHGPNTTIGFEKINNPFLQD